MNGLVSRLQRIERKAGPSDPFQHLTDDELEAAIAAVKASIEAESGMTEPELAESFERDLTSGNRTFELDDKLMRAFVDQVKREYRLNA
jgi:hypothetical protein